MMQPFQNMSCHLLKSTMMPFVILRNNIRYVIIQKKIATISRNDAGIEALEA